MRNKHRNSGMNLTSIGFHTFNAFHKLTVYEGDTILNDAYDFQKDTNEIRVRPLIMNDDELDSDEFTEKLKSGSRYFLIEYTTKHKGLSWLLRLRPKLFVGVKDYLSASSAENLEGVEEHFNLEAAKFLHY